MSAKSKVKCLLEKGEELIGIIKHEYRYIINLMYI